MDLEKEKKRFDVSTPYDSSLIFIFLNILPSISNKFI